MSFGTCTCGPWWGVIPPPPCPVHTPPAANRCPNRQCFCPGGCGGYPSFTTVYIFTNGTQES